MRKTALAFLAHPDDAEILCGGTLARLATSGWAVHICTCTAGDCGTMDKCPADISAIRKAEGKAAAAVIGATYHCLNELDALVCYDKPTLRKAYDLFRQIAPNLVFIHHPDDYMMDHVESSTIGRASSFIYGAPNISSLPLPPDFHVPHLYYCDTIEGVGSRGADIQPTSVIDISRSINTKIEMLACHASQREWLRKHHGMDEYLEATKRQSKSRGQLLGTEFAEGFVQHKGHAYPRNDLLKELLGHSEA